MKKITKKNIVLKLIFDLGGEASREQFNPKYPEYCENFEIKLREEAFEIEEGVGKPYFWHNTASICQQLKDRDGYLEITERGIWKITEKGFDYLKSRELDDSEDTKIQQVQIKENEYNENSFIKIKTPDHLEKDLHPFLTYYTYHHLKCFTRTIKHSKSYKKEFREWAHPDMVGSIFPMKEWKEDVIKFSRAIGNISIKILSFEIKRELTFTNLRESFFQCVSNSSWANESFLVASKISNKEDFRNELKRLSTSFGIGIIKLDIEDPDSSITVLPAKNKNNLDWETINKLTMNPDFKNFIDQVEEDISRNKPYKEKYDTVYDKQELVKL